jgi:hypothetical protein
VHFKDVLIVVGCLIGFACLAWELIARFRQRTAYPRLPALVQVVNLVTMIGFLVFVMRELIADVTQ